MTKFKRKKEDFICDSCKQSVIGNGYTNHCPNCLLSKHVDMKPGDRASGCHGIMDVIGIEGSNIEDMQLVHKCRLCGHVKRNRFAKNDNFDAIAAIVKKKASQLK